MSQRWEAIFDELVEESADVRAARLATLATSDPELARFLTELLAADRTEEELIGAPLLARARSSSPSAPTASSSSASR